MLRSALTALSPPGRRGRLTILIFHRVFHRRDPLLPAIPDAEQFEAQMRWVREWFNVLPLLQAVERLYEGCIPARALAITFDDGYADNEQIAAPILRRLGLTATFFVSSGFLSGETMWNDRIIEAIRTSPLSELDLEEIGLSKHDLSSIESRRKAIDVLLSSTKRLDPTRRSTLVDHIVACARGTPARWPMMSPSQLRRLRSLGMNLGAHTVTHLILSRLSSEAAHKEIAGGKEALETILDEPVKMFAYPNGVPQHDFGAEHAALARQCGFTGAVTTAWGAASMATDPFQLPRFSPWDHHRTRYGLRLALNVRTDAVQAA